MSTFEKKNDGLKMLKKKIYVLAQHTKYGFHILKLKYVGSIIHFEIVKPNGLLGLGLEMNMTVSALLGALRSFKSRLASWAYP